MSSLELETSPAWDLLGTTNVQVVVDVVVVDPRKPERRPLSELGVLVTVVGVCRHGGFRPTEGFHLEEFYFKGPNGEPLRRF